MASAGSAEAEVSDKVAAIYLFLFRSLSEANMEHSVEKLDDVLRVLDVERETWAQVCEQYGSTRDESPESVSSSPAESLGVETDTPQPAPQTPRVPTMPPLDLPDSSLTESGGISFEA